MIFHIWFINDYIYQYLRILRRSKSTERYQIFFVFSRIFLGCSRFAGNLISLHCCGFPGTFGYGSKQCLPNKRSCILRYRLTYQFRIDPFYHCSLLIENLPNYMRFIIRTTIDNRTISSSHLNHRTIVVLTKRVGRQGRSIHIILIIYQCFCICLSWQINSRSGTKSKHFLVFAKTYFPCHGGNLHHTIITRLHERFCHSQITMTTCFDTGDLPPAHFLISIADKGFAAVNNSFFHRCGHSKNLLWRAWLISITDAIIPPDLVPRHLLPIGTNIFIGKIFCHLFYRYRFIFFVFSVVCITSFFQAKFPDFFLSILPVKFSRIVQIKFPIAGHGQDFPIIGIHYHHTNML